MEPKINFYLDRAISAHKVSQLSKNADQRKEIESKIKTEPRQIWAFLTFIKNERIKIYTGERIEQVYWDPDRQRVNSSKFKHGAHDFNQWLSKIETEILTEVRTKYRFNPSEAPTKENLQNLMRGVIQRSKEQQPNSRRVVTVLSHIKAYVEEEKYNWSDGFTRGLMSSLEHLKEFEVWRGKPMNAEEDYLQVWRSFREYLLSRKVEVKDQEPQQLKNSTANKHLKIFRRLLRAMARKGVIDLDLEGLKKFEEPEPFHIALRQSEIDALTKAKFDKPHLEVARDLMVLQIYCGQRVGDLPQALDQLKAKGSIHVLQKKGGNRVTIPIFPALQTHMEGLRKKYPDGLTAMSEQRYNDHLKEICKAVGIDQIHTFTEVRGDKSLGVSIPRYELVSSHTCRRTFCTICAGRGISHKAIMAITGHRSHKIFLQYIRVDDTSISEEFNEKML